MLVNRLRRRRVGLVLLAVLRTATGAGCLFVVFFAADYFMAPGPRTRLVLDAAALAWLAGVLAFGIGQAVRLSPRQMAVRLDRVMESPRKTALSALELSRWLNTQDEEGLGSYLGTSAIARAVGIIERTGWRECLPLQELRRQARGLGLCAAAVAAVCVWNLEATGIIVQRIVAPFRDVPPYSAFTFEVTPAQAQVIYGGDLFIQADITGEQIPDEVWFVTRFGRKTYRTVCFQEGPTRFAQRLEHVMQPVEFCFRTGKARSRWYPVSVLLEPRVAVAAARVVRPEYTGLPARTFYIGSEDLAVLKGSKVQLKVTSNRPLLDGRAEMYPAGWEDAGRIFTGQKIGPHCVAFEWAAKDEVDIEITLRDIRGTESRTPYRFAQRILPDQPPDVVIEEPPLFSLATPSVRIPIRGYAEDDLGLRHVGLVRALVGYRDRIRPAGFAGAAAEFVLEDEIDLARLGVREGDILEFYLEASDLNPRLTGVSVSEVARLQIISEEEYARMLRLEVTTREFLERFRAAEAGWSRLRDAMEKLESGLASDQTGSREAGQSVQEARRATDELQETLEGLVQDFPAYDLETQLQDASQDALELVRRTADVLADTRPPYEGLRRVLDRLMRDYRRAEEAVQSVAARAEETARLARIMQDALTFTRLVGEQERLVRRLARFKGDYRNEDMALLPDMQHRQQSIREALVRLMGDLSEHTKDIPFTYTALVSDVDAFQWGLNQAGIDLLMQQAENKAHNRDGREAHRYARRALEQMQALMQTCAGNAFGGCCQGELRFHVRAEIRETIRQMLAALCLRAGHGNDSLSGYGVGPYGSGFGGSSSDGYWMGGHSLMNVPVFGPDRRAFRSHFERGGGLAPGGRRRDGRRRAGTQGGDRFAVTEQESVTAAGMSFEQVPGPYREAVKKYFSGEEERP
ncbi:MAG: hypothetical protein K9N49_10545 [Candidatus Marinimicrobia bacterium]|nr:hypothetical protein [Candidatus Neomarinimicrobiota bacterium]